MIDINLIRTNKELVKENIKKKFQDDKLPLVDEVEALDKEARALKQEGDNLRQSRNTLSSQIGALMKEKKFEDAEKIKEQVRKNNERIAEIEVLEEELSQKIRKIMLTIPNLIDDSVPIGKNDEENVEIERFGEAKVPSFEIPHHADIVFNSIVSTVVTQYLLKNILVMHSEYYFITTFLIELILFRT